MVVALIAGQARRHFLQGEFGQDGYPIEGLLTVHRNIVAHGLKRLARKGGVDAFGLLQANDIRLALGQPGQQVVQPLLDGIDVPSRDLH
jgi:hypothetical protein